MALERKLEKRIGEVMGDWHEGLGQGRPRLP